MTTADPSRLLPEIATRPVATPAPALRRSRSVAWWGTVALIITESMLFAGLLSSYGFLRASATHWPPGGIPKPELLPTGIASIFLVGSSLPAWWAERGIKQGRQWQLRLGLLIAWLMAAGFVVHSIIDYLGLHYGWTDNAYGSVYYTTTGLHLAHVIIALILGVGVQTKAWMRRYDDEHHVSVEVLILYWHFVDVVWIFVFATLFLSEHW
jgi:cytochrome c oxidase subunit 3